MQRLTSVTQSQLNSILGLGRSVLSFLSRKLPVFLLSLSLEELGGGWDWGGHELAARSEVPVTLQVGQSLRGVCVTLGLVALRGGSVAGNVGGRQASDAGRKWGGGRGGEFLQLCA